MKAFMRSLLLAAGCSRVCNGGAVTLTMNGNPSPAIGSYSFPSQANSIVFDNGLVQFSFGELSNTMLLTSAIINNTELAHNLTGESFYIDAAGGKQSLVCDTVKIIRVSSSLVEVAFADTKSSPLQFEHHLIMTSDTMGLYGYNIMTAARDTQISEVRMNVRWDRCIFDHAYNWERGHDSQQPTYAYLYTQDKIQDETWRVDGINNASLPCPDTNAGGLPAGTVYTKYDWSLYHHENPMFGQYGNGFGAWFTPLGGVTDTTSAATYGVGPNHQDLAIHQDAIVLDYMGPNHYGLPGYSIPQGYKRLYGPWLTHLTTGDPSDPGAMIGAAAATAYTAIKASIPFLPLIQDVLYPTARTTVHGQIVIPASDGRSPQYSWVLLSIEVVEDVYTIHEATYFVKADHVGNFSLPGIVPGTFSLYVFSSFGSITGQFRQDGIQVAGADLDLGQITWTPVNHPNFLFQVGQANREGGEFNLGNQPRGWDLPGLVPGSLTYTIGTSHEQSDWYYAQTQGGVWTVAFPVTETYTGIAYLTVSASMTDGDSPSVAVNGVAAGITGAMPSGMDSTLSRQAVRSGYPRLAVLQFDASRLVNGDNTITFTRPAGNGNNTGMGWDTVLLEVDGSTTPLPPALLTASIMDILQGEDGTWTARVSVHNDGEGTAYGARVNHVRLVSAQEGGMDVLGCTEPNLGHSSMPYLVPQVLGRDPLRCPVPVGLLRAGQSTVLDIHFRAEYLMGQDRSASESQAVPVLLSIEVEAAGGRVRTVAALPAGWAMPGTQAMERCGRAVTHPHVLEAWKGLHAHA